MDLGNFKGDLLKAKKDFVSLYDAAKNAGEKEFEDFAKSVLGVFESHNVCEEVEWKK